MKIGVPKEILPGEHRVAAVPETVAKMVKMGMEVSIESGAGLDAYIDDKDYTAVGATISAAPWTATLKNLDVILKVQRPVVDEKNKQYELQTVGENAVLIGFFLPLTYPESLQQFIEKKLTVFSLDLLPRIARAQSMDVLSSMSNIAGYKSVLIAADSIGKFFPMLMTAAGNILPAKIVVIGAGVAGLQAIATARRLGGVVTAFDTRPAAAEQVKSLGADFVSLEVAHEQAQDAGGYARELPAEFYQKEQEIVRKHAKEADVIITTALIPGKRAPILITEAMVKEMRPGSIIIDLAAEQGGNCTLTQAGKIVTQHRITLVGLTNLPSMVPIHASQLYAKNVFAFLNHLIPDGKALHLDLADEIIKSTMVTHRGEIVHPTVKKTLQAKG